ncbi:MAG: hypothetical protein R3B70_14710 [Polyangiaceae bacterium]
MIGAPYVDNRRSANVFTGDDLDIFAAFGEQAAIAGARGSLPHRARPRTGHLAAT